MPAPVKNTPSRAGQFWARKRRILADLGSSTPDLSPKGSVDVEIADLVALLNQYDDIVTTSSCAGRVACYLEGEKKSGEDRKDLADGPGNDADVDDPITTSMQQSKAGGGGKGAGRWLYVSHTPVEFKDDQPLSQLLFDSLPILPSPALGIYTVSPTTRFARLKFEPMILHILTSNLETAQKLLTCAINSSFRESGIVNALSLPLVAVRTNGLSFDAPVGIYDDTTGHIISLMDNSSLQILVQLANSRFAGNKQRTTAFQTSVEETMKKKKDVVGNSSWEPKAERAERLKKEGLERRNQVENRVESQKNSPANIDVMQDFFTPYDVHLIA